MTCRACGLRRFVSVAVTRTGSCGVASGSRQPSDAIAFLSASSGLLRVVRAADLDRGLVVTQPRVRLTRDPTRGRLSYRDHHQTFGPLSVHQRRLSRSSGRWSV